MTCGSVKVTIHRERGDDCFRAVIGEDPFSLVAWSFPPNSQHRERWENINPPSSGGSILSGWDPNDAKKWGDLLLVSVRVMKHLHEEGLKYDKVVARRKGKA